MNIQQQQQQHYSSLNHNSNDLIQINSNNNRLLNKVKRNKTDIINNIVTSYLERRNYTTITSNSNNNNGSNDDSDNKLSNNVVDDNNSCCLTSEQMAVALYTDAATARSNSILYSSCNNEPKQIMQHYLKWLNWLCNIKNIGIQTELWCIAGPLLCHLHVETLKANTTNTNTTNNTTPILTTTIQQQQQQLYKIFERLRKEYHEKYQQYLINFNKFKQQQQYNHDNDNDNDDVDNDLILRDDDDNNILLLQTDINITSTSTSTSTVCTSNTSNTNTIVERIFKILEHEHILTISDIESHLDLMTFRSCKYQLNLTKQSFNYLLKYLSQQSHIIIIQILQTWFDIHIINNNNYNNKQHMISINNNNNNCILEQQEQEQHEQELLINDNNDKTDLLLNNLNDSILKMNQIHPPLLAYHFYNYQNKCSISAASIDDNFDYLAYANEHSEIYLYYRNTLSLYNDNDNNNITKVSLSLSDNNYNKIILRGHNSTIYDIKFINSQYLLSISHDSTLKLWNYQENRQVVQYVGHQAPIWCMDTSAYNMYVGTGSQDKSIRLWTLEQIYPIRVCSGHTSDIMCIKFHPNSLYIGSGSADHTIRLWNIIDGSIVRLFNNNNYNKSIQCLEFSPDGKYLICSFISDLFLQIWDIAQANKLLEFKLNININNNNNLFNINITKLLWCKLNNYLYITLNNGFIYIYNMNLIINNNYNNINNIEPLFIINTKCTQNIINIQNIQQHIVYIGIIN